MYLSDLSAARLSVGQDRQATGGVEEMEELRELVNKIIADMRDLEKFLIESTYGKKTIAQTARVKTIELRKLFKSYNALTKKECPIRVIKDEKRNLK